MTPHSRIKRLPDLQCAAPIHKQGPTVQTQVRLSLSVLPLGWSHEWGSLGWSNDWSVLPSQLAEWSHDQPLNVQSHRAERCSSNDWKLYRNCNKRSSSPRKPNSL